MTKSAPPPPAPPTDLPPSAEAMNRRLARLLSRFGMNGERILADVAANRIGAGQLLRNPALIDPGGLIKLHAIGMMDAMLELASGGKPVIALPKNPKAGLNAIALFLRLNHTPQFFWRENDTPSAWSTRVFDALFISMADEKIFGFSDFLALDRLSGNPLWQGLFGSSLDLYLKAVANPARIQMLDQTTSQSAVNAFRNSSTQRQARLPKVKYGNPLASFKDIAEYAIGEYLEGLDVNEALERTLVQTQLGLTDPGGKERFEAFLRDNRIDPGTFPTTVQVLYERVLQQVRFQESEAEVAAVCYAYADEIKATARIEKLFSNFADAVLSVAARCRRHFSFDGMTAMEGAAVIARWAKRSRVLADIRKGGLARQVPELIRQLGPAERRHLLAFRDGRTEARSVSGQDIERYVRARCKMLTLSAQQAKINRVERLLQDQIDGAEQFILRPGQAALQNMTFGVEVFFRTLRTVMEDICAGTGSLLREQMKVLSDFQQRYGPLTTVALLYPITPGTRPEKWLQDAREALRRIGDEAFEAPPPPRLDEKAQPITA